MRSVAAVWVLGCLQLTAALSQTGCTLLGMGIGFTADQLSADRYEAVEAENARLERGQKISVTTSRRERYTGKYAGVTAPTPSDPRSYLLLEVQNQQAPVLWFPTNDVVEVGVEVKGKGWIYGAIAGAVVDVAVIVAASQMYNHEGGPN